MSEYRTGVSKVTVELNSGEKVTWTIAEGWYRVSNNMYKALIGQTTPPPFRELEVGGRISDAVTPSERPQSIPENDEVANGIDD